MLRCYTNSKDVYFKRHGYLVKSQRLPDGPTEKKHKRNWKVYLKRDLYPEIKVKIVLPDGTVCGRTGMDLARL